MPINFGNTNIEAINYNGTSLDKVIYNGVTVWEKVKVISLGIGQSFNISGIYDNWGELTADNFYIRDSTTFSDTGWTANQIYQDRGNGDAQSSLYKLYDKYSGTLTCYVHYKYDYRDSNNASPRYYNKQINVEAFLITKTPTDLGTAQSFYVGDVYPNYRNLTADNFYIKEITPFKSTGWTAGWIYSDRGTGNARSEIVKSYDAVNGILTCYLHYIWDYRDSNGTTPKSFNEKQNVHVYLCDAKPTSG